ncbi:hypothetical protein PPL_05760 [Heterostelium album PN500]|uniref:PH domain-containing protein n=1 Tax=Heterostelium pallidum (strain ATCC 26659 / Pp 5 / PN500) TaxID=670386 RepID=D3BB28_HETP5|nr:hypothetical protein PPL_05760 [Heterostelium album PN500]EFA81765.1 hypothetical protein PPL_05760 [Heterostelium album PN500]|eukprot:XP_020433882.1 hypothetical protein PPL_05760 [Heterostelium album PN500]
MKNETNIVSSNTSNGASTLPNIPMNITVNELFCVDKRNGYLKKLGGKGISKNWRRRFFVLTNTGILYYFKQRTSTEAVGAVDLSQYTKCYKDKTKKNYFFITNENDPSQRVFHLIADSAQEMEEWITEITSFFEGDVSDLKQHLMGVKQQKSDSKLNVAQSSNRDDDLDKFQLVFKGERVSLLLSDQNSGNNNNNSSSSGSGSAASTSSSPIEQSPKVTKNPPPIPVRRPTFPEIQNNQFLEELRNSSKDDDDDDEDDNNNTEPNQ